MKPVVLIPIPARPVGTVQAGAFVHSAPNAPKAFTLKNDWGTIVQHNLEASPLLLPTVFDPQTTEAFLKSVDAIILPGSYSNVHPSHYGEAPIYGEDAYDLQHDHTDFFLARAAYSLDLPLLGICRGMQAMNVAFGGSLKQFLDTTTGINHECSTNFLGEDHSREDIPQYTHPLTIRKGSFLHQIVGLEETRVNSLHGQGIKTPAQNFHVEARASDGQIEAVSAIGETFFMGVQWHPENMPAHPVSQSLFNAFRKAMYRHMEQRLSAEPR